jgi:hypothetical protein
MAARTQSQTIRNYPPELEAEKTVGFAPVENGSPAALSPLQIQSFNERGFIHRIGGIFSDSEVAAHRAFFDHGLAECTARGRDENAINGYHTKLKSMYELAADPRVLAIVNDLLGGEPFACVMTNFLCKLPRNDKWVPW